MAGRLAGHAGKNEQGFIPPFRAFQPRHFWFNLDTLVDKVIIRPDPRSRNQSERLLVSHVS